MPARPIGMTNHEHRIRELLNYTWEDYGGLVRQMSPDVRDEFVEANTLLTHLLLNSPSFQRMSTRDKAKVTAALVAFGPLGFTQEYYLGDTVEDWDADVGPADADLCTVPEERGLAMAGGGGCTVEWTPDCFFLAKPPSDDLWKNAHYAAFKCEDWELELAQAERRMSAAICAVDQELGTQGIDPSTGLSLCEGWAAAADETETIIESQKKDLGKSFTLGPIVPWLIAAGLFFVVTRAEQ